MAVSKNNPDGVPDLILKALCAAFPNTLIFVDSTGRIVEQAETAADTLKYDADELRDAPFKDLLLPEYREPFQSELLVAVQEGRTGATMTARLRTRTGACIPVEIRSLVLPAAQTHPPIHCVVVRNTQQRKKYEQELLEAERTAATGQLSSCVGHDVANPLSVIKLYSEWLISELQETLQTKEDPLLSHLLQSVQNIEKSADRIEELVTKMRNYARSTEREVSEIDYKDSIADALFFVNEQLRAANVRVELDLPGEDTPVAAQPDQLCQIFIHLLRNAADSFAACTEKEHPVVRITLRREIDDMAADSQLYTCTVADNGPGLTEETQERIFEPFFTTKTEAGAAGLGLTVVRNVVRRHGGDIQITSEPGQGTTVVFRLPAATEPIKGDEVG